MINKLEELKQAIISLNIRLKQANENNLPLENKILQLNEIIDKLNQQRNDATQELLQLRTEHQNKIKELETVRIQFKQQNDMLKQQLIQKEAKINHFMQNLAELSKEFKGE